jgi:D-alanyl-D-alanine carboxypeptidase (penicillin-binding protein 5/6)
MFYFFRTRQRNNQTKKLSALILALLLFISASISLPLSASASDIITYSSNSASTQNPISQLYAKYAVLLDADSGRVLVGKNENEKAPMASTTKIMTCILALEYGKEDQLCTASAYASSMPDVQLGVTKGEAFHLGDLLYSLMLKSHNDSAVIIAENIAYGYIFQVQTGNLTNDTILSHFDLSFVPTNQEYNSTFLSELSTTQSKILVAVFASLMNQKAQILGCTNTYFITPNGLDASDENGTHSTTARDLAVIMSYCIQNPQFLTITQTANYSFSSYRTDASGAVVSGGRTYSVSNANAFLNMYDNIISGKTGFTADAGYCYVCAWRSDNRTFIVVLLACGWPSNKTYKWHDAKILLGWGREKYFMQNIISRDFPLKSVSIQNGINTTAQTCIDEEYNLLLSDTDAVNVVIQVPEYLEAPIHSGQIIGHILVYINDELQKEIPVYVTSNSARTDYNFYLKKLLKRFVFIDK